jgi:cysteinyl-tRNA synthetase
LKLQHPIDTYPQNLTLEEFHRFGSLRARFEAAMDDDLSTAQALGYLFEAVRLLNRLLEEPSTDPGYLTILKEMYDELVDLGRVLNLLQADPRTMVTTLRQKAADLKITPEEIQQLIDQRTQARLQKDWARADAIRQQLTDLDIWLEDTPQGTIWRVKS